MRSSFLPFSRPQITDDDVGAVTEVMRSGWLTTGKHSLEFENEFALRVGASGAVAVASATAGMHVALSALGIGPGDEVITPSMTWVSTPNIITLLGAKPVWADADRDTLLTSAALIEPLVTERTKAIIPVHYAGAPVDMDPVRELAARRGIPVIEDAAHSIGTTYKGRVIGAEGTCIFSFHPIKNITTGEGGLITSGDAAFLDRVRRLKFHGLAVDAFDRHMQGRKPQAMVVEPGYKYNMTDMAAALGRSQLRRLDAMNAERTELAAFYDSAFADIPEILPLAVPPWPHAHCRSLYVIRLNTPRVGRDVFMERLKSRNIGSGIHFLACHTHTYYRDARPARLPDTEWNSERMLSIPLFPGMSMEDAADVVAAVKESLA